MQLNKHLKQNLINVSRMKTQEQHKLGRGLGFKKTT